MCIIIYKYIIYHVYAQNIIPHSFRMVVSLAWKFNRLIIHEQLDSICNAQAH